MLLLIKLRIYFKMVRFLLLLFVYMMYMMIAYYYLYF